MVRNTSRRVNVSLHWYALMMQTGQGVAQHLSYQRWI